MKNQFPKPFIRCRIVELFSFRRHLRFISFLVLLAFLNLIIGCYYYKVKTVYQPDPTMPPRIDNLMAQQKFFIVHFGSDAWWLKNITISEDKTELSGMLEKLPANRYSFYKTQRNKPNRYQKNEKHVLHEVHIYAQEFTEKAESGVVIPIESIQRIEIYDPHQGATVASWVFGIAGGLVATYIAIIFVAAIYLILTLPSQSSCPYIYTYNGEYYAFAGEIFSGALQPGLERNDYLRLPELKPNEGEYLISVRNELQEVQHINLMQLKVIDHPADIEVLADKYGQVHSIAEPNPPIHAEASVGNDFLAAVIEKDSHFYNFDNAANTHATFDGIVVTFEKPEEAKEAKLIVRAKNSMWLEYVFASFHEMFGRKYNSFDKREGKKKPEYMREMMKNQGFPLNVYLEKNGTWELQDFFEVAGPMALKDDILLLNLDGIENETIRIKLETGFMFWELDYVAIDFTNNIPLEITTVSASEVLDDKDDDYSEAVRYDDHLYYVQPETGDVATITFPVPEFTNDMRTVILHSKGFYKVLRDQTGPADWKALKSFREPGRMPLFSKELHDDMMKLFQQQ